MADNGPAPFVTDIEAATRATTPSAPPLDRQHLQLTVMCLQPEEEIGLEVHHDRDQFLRIEEGPGGSRWADPRRPVVQREVRGRRGPRAAGPGTTSQHRRRPLRLYSVYGPAEHEPGTVHLTKAEADAAEHDH